MEDMHAQGLVERVLIRKGAPTDPGDLLSVRGGARKKAATATATAGAGTGTVGTATGPDKMFVPRVLDLARRSVWLWRLRVDDEQAAQGQSEAQAEAQTKT